MQLTRQAVKHLRKIPKKDQTSLKAVLASMQAEPFAGDIRKLTGYNAYRRRVGTYRIIFTVVEKDLVILVFDIMKRNERTYS